MAAKVLVVDDSPDARALYGEYLEFCGFRVETAADGEEAVEKARRDRPAVILMDLSMPKRDGGESIRCVRADRTMAEVSIVVLSGYAWGDELERSQKAGDDLCMSKSFL